MCEKCTTGGAVSSSSISVQGTAGQTACNSCCCQCTCHRCPCCGRPYPAGMRTYPYGPYWPSPVWIGTTTVGVGSGGSFTYTAR